MSDGAPITATLAVEPPPQADCAITGQDDDVSVQDHNITFDRSRSDVALDGGTCNANVVEDADGQHTDRYVQSDVEDDRFCLIFHEVDCVPTLERVQNGRLVISVLLPDRETLRELVERMREVGSTVSVQGITQSSAEGKESVMLDLTDVTGKQREALMVAIDAGYYDTPREADLDTLADRLGISKSAVSQRLKAVESKLAHKLVDHWTA